MKSKYAILIFLFLSNLSHGQNINVGVSTDGAGGSNNLKLDNLEVVRGGYAIGEGEDKIEIPYSYQVTGDNSDRVIIKLDLKNENRIISILDIIVLLEDLPLKLSFPEGIDFWIREIPDATL